MKRDMDLVRRILTELSDTDNPLPASAFADGEHTVDEVSYHIYIMDQGGLIEATVIGSSGCPYTKAVANRLTWNGNDFLADIKSDSVWSDVKMTIAKSASDASFSVIASLASELAKRAVFSGIGLLM